MLKIDEQLLVAALKKEKPTMPKTWAARYAAQLIRTTDERLERNVLEWIQGAPLSDLSYTATNGEMFSITSLMASEENYTFVEALEVMNMFFKDEAAARGMMARIYM